MKRVLMVAYHFPPLAGGSGIQRTLRFAQQLPGLGWEPIVLTARAQAYERTGKDLLSEIPAGIRVERAFAFDAARHLAVAGRYPAFLARPDRWISWRFAAVVAGLRLIRNYKPQIIWSTYPIATAHVIGALLHARSHLPWIADFRDPMAQDGYPADPGLWRSFKRVEEKTVRNARFSVFTTPGAARMYRDRYPDAAERIAVIENGYDEESFVGTDSPQVRETPLNPGALTLLHSGLVYPSERDPASFFAALRRTIDRGRVRSSTLKVRFRASGHDEMLTMFTRKHDLHGFVELMPPIAYRDALEEMVRADALLLLQAANCNEQIPAKLYEYMRASRPILALTDPHGDTAAVLSAAGLDTLARLDSVDEITLLLERLVDDAQRKRLPVPGAEYVAGASRRARTTSLSKLLHRATEPL